MRIAVTQPRSERTRSRAAFHLQPLIPRLYEEVPLWNWKAEVTGIPYAIRDVVPYDVEPPVQRSIEVRVSLDAFIPLPH